MYEKEIAYKDFNGVERKEKFYFHFSKAELHEMEYGTVGGMHSMLQKIIEAKDTPTLVEVFKKMILDSYGEKSSDGRYFLKEDDEGHKLCRKFAQTEAFSTLYMLLAENDEEAAAFVNGIIPQDDVVNKSAIPFPEKG